MNYGSDFYESLGNLARSIDDALFWAEEQDPDVTALRKQTCALALALAIKARRMEHLERRRIDEKMGRR